MGYCLSGHDGCPCGHNRTKRTLRDLAVPRHHRVLVAVSYYVLRQWRE
jgi:hypothetical protein